jgi:allantoinase
VTCTYQLTCCCSRSFGQRKPNSIFLSAPYHTIEGQRHANMESLYDYGSRAGFWRLHRLFTKKKIPATVFAVGMALERNPAVCHALKETPEWEVASHGYRWIDYQNIDPETEKEHIARTIKIHEKLLGKRPVGFYQGKVCN